MDKKVLDVGYVGFIYVGDPDLKMVGLGQFSFPTVEESVAFWESIAGEDGLTDFNATYFCILDRVLKSKAISAQTCEKFLGKPIAALIEGGFVSKGSRSNSQVTMH